MHDTLILISIKRGDFVVEILTKNDAESDFNRQSIQKELKSSKL